MDKPKLVIATHSGSFHADEILGVATLLLVYENNHLIEIVRTRDMEKIKNADIVLDVGGVYDSNRERFDHHQSGGAGIRENGIPYAAFGLVWKKYGPVVCGSQNIADKIEKKMVLPVDAIDNGKEIYTPIFKEVFDYSLGDMFSAYKVTWKENTNELDTRFIYLVRLAKDIIQREIVKIKDRQEAKEIVLKIYEKIEDKRVLLLDSYYPWYVAIDSMPELLIAIYPDISEKEWCLEVARENEDTFVSKILFPESWAGKRGEELEKITNISGSLFCHNGRFFAVTKTKEAALQLAEIALNS